MDNQRARAAETVHWRRKLQRIFIASTAVDLILISIALISLLMPLITKETALNVCTSPTCMSEASQIERQLNLRANPCENLHEFVCGNPQPNSDPIITLKELAKEQMVDLYQQPIATDDHPMVATMKKLFGACVDEVSHDVSVGNIEKIKRALKMAGGWPLLEGPEWNETKFDWLKATYKFREMGYHFTVFLNVSVTENEKNRSKNIIQVLLPKPDVAFIESMIEVATLFGADTLQASYEIQEIYNYILQLLYQFEYSQQIKEDCCITLSVGEYQKKQGHKFTLDWLEFINKIISPVARISEKDLVLFPDPRKINIWLYSLSKTPKRVQANYMMWTVAAKIIADLKFDEYNYKQFLYSWDYTKKRRCLEHIQKKFRIFPSPIDVLYIKKYLPENNIKIIKELLNNVKRVNLEQIKKSSWLDVKDKQIIIQSITKLTQNTIIGAPKGHFKERFLDEISVDMKKPDQKGFFGLLLQVCRNYQSLLYAQINWSAKETKSVLWNLLSASENSLSYYGSSLINLPATILQSPLFNENRPNYLNYGSLGSFIAAEFACHLTDMLLAEKKPTVWSEKTQRWFLKTRQCFLKQVMDNLKINGVRNEWDYQLLHQTLSTNISYLAYKKWEGKNGIEPKLASSAYSNEELFWISAAAFYCHQLYPFPSILDFSKQYSFYANGLAINNKDFAKAFRCFMKSKMNPEEKCYVF